MLKKILIGLAVVAVLLFVGFQVLTSTTKKASPEVKQTYTVGGAKIDLFYCQPSKKGRVIFGGLLPFGEVWRTGANEPTTFETDKGLTVGGKSLPAGKYSIWTIPQKDNWTVIFNKEIPTWGVSLVGKASRNDKEDVLQVVAPVETLPTVQEKLSIDAQNNALTIAWDLTKISVPLQ
ncbi:MAG: DUF2911 domain-containing protein [Arcicella sp.]|jgi:hypothetical protein|nr:DUF2911 domain-containing protein [Arcicella sp.]